MLLGMSQGIEKGAEADIPLDDLIVDRLLFGDISHDEKWRALGPGDAGEARQALITAHDIRSQHGDAAGEVYLAHFADVVAIARFRETLRGIHMLPELELPEAS
jgi:hypothetical protein